MGHRGILVYFCYISYHVHIMHIIYHSVDGWPAPPQSSESLLECDDIGRQLWYHACQDSIIDIVTFGRCLDDIVCDDIDVIIQVEQTVSRGQNNSRRANTRKNDRVNLLARKNLFQGIASTSVVSCLLNDNVLCKRLAQIMITWKD
jgi:hypothetical protein